MHGRHLLIDMYDCPAELINDPKLVEETLLQAARVSKATILQHCFHQFAPQGVSGVIVIAESHISIHTWPESGYAALDIFTCGKDMRPELAIDLMKGVFEPKHVQIKDEKRGVREMSVLLLEPLEQTQRADFDEITVPNFRGPS